MSQESNGWIIGLLTADSAIAALVDVENIMISDPDDRPALLDEEGAAQVVLRSESETPETASSQGGVREETIYIEIRSRDKQKVHDLKARVQAVLEDASGVLPSGASVYRVRHDWNRAPFKNPDGVTYECQIRYVVWYR